MIKILSWNIGARSNFAQELSKSGADVALLQEVKRLPDDLPANIKLISGGSFTGYKYDRWPMIMQLSDRVSVKGYKLTNLSSYPYTHDLPTNTLAVSDPTTMAVACVALPGGSTFHVASLYARWIKPHDSTNSKWGVGYSDASAHRAISDLSVFIGSLDSSTHRILVAGDFNMIYGATDKNPLALPAREQSVVDRFTALGLEFLGPKYPEGRQASPTPQGLPGDTLNVPTYYSTRQKPATAQNQLDYVFASRGFHKQIKVRALNSVEEWGPSDHCRLLIEVRI